MLSRQHAGCQLRIYLWSNDLKFITEHLLWCGNLWFKFGNIRYWADICTWNIGQLMYPFLRLESKWIKSCWADNICTVSNSLTLTFYYVTWKQQGTSTLKWQLLFQAWELPSRSKDIEWLNGHPTDLTSAKQYDPTFSKWT